MEKQLVIANNGQEIQIDDINTLGEVSARADDRAIQEFMRLDAQGGFTDRLILPTGGTQDLHSLVAPTASVTPRSLDVMPFRAVLGPHTLLAVNVDENLRGTNSAYCLGTSPSLVPSGIQLSPQFAQGSGNPRWDLLYAELTINANASTVVRYVKDPTTSVITAQNVVNSQKSTVSLQVLAGTPGASPTPPPVPGDAGGVYRFPICYVRIPGSWGPSAVIGKHDICMAMPFKPINHHTGAMSMVPSESNSVKGNTSISVAAMQSWGSTGTRPATYLPSDMTGAKTILVALDLASATPAQWSHQSGGVIDFSIDWRNRLFFVTAVGVNNTGDFSWNEVTPNTTLIMPSARAAIAPKVTVGQSCVADDQVSGSTLPLVWSETDMSVSYINTSSFVNIYVDPATGQMKLLTDAITNLPRCKIFLKIEASGKFSNNR